MKELLRFKEDSIKGQKTKRFLVYSTHSNDLLGYIHWRSSWRCYVMSYDNDIDMSLSCGKELDNFMEILERERNHDIKLNNIKEAIKQKVAQDRN